MTVRLAGQVAIIAIVLAVVAYGAVLEILRPFERARDRM